MFTLEESALLGRMLRTLAVMGLCLIGGVAYLLARPQHQNGPPEHHRLRPHLVHRTTPEAQR
jgi:hypothetical protein